MRGILFLFWLIFGYYRDVACGNLEIVGILSYAFVCCINSSSVIFFFIVYICYEHAMLWLLYSSYTKGF